MCKANSIQQHNGVNVTPEATLQFKEGGLLKFKDRYVMQHLALDLGYPFYLHDGHIYTAEVESVKIADEASVFQTAMPIKNKAKDDAEARYVVNDKVAVVYRPSYGSGWSSHDSRSHKQNCFLAMNGQLARLVENKNWTGVESLVKERYPEFYLGNIEALRIRWVPKGTTFEIENYDGFERIEVKGEDFFHAA